MNLLPLCENETPFLMNCVSLTRGLSQQVGVTHKSMDENFLHLFDLHTNHVIVKEITAKSHSK